MTHRRTRSTVVALALLSVLAAGCLWSDLPSPATDRHLKEGDREVASYPLIDGYPESGWVRVAPHGLTASLNTWGQGARFHVTIEFQNDSGELVTLEPYDARVRDLGNVEIRLLELKAGDESPKTVEVPAGERRVIDLLFGGTVLKGPHRWETFKTYWSYTVGDLKVDRVAVWDQVEKGPGTGPGPWVWMPDADPGHIPLRAPRWERGRDAGT